MATTKSNPTPKETVHPRKPRAKKAVVAKSSAIRKSPAISKSSTAPKPSAELEEKADKKITEKQDPHTEPRADKKYVFSVGRRKTSVANIRLFEGQDKNLVNKSELEKYFGNRIYAEQAIKPMQLTGTETKYHVYVNIKGGGLNSQSQAVAHGIARAMAIANPDFRKQLKKNGLLTRDSRMKERKKPGLKRARRGPQWAKR